MIPVLPGGQIRAAIAAEDWDLATELLEVHDRAVATALATVDMRNEPPGPWRELLAAQKALVEELLAARTDVAQALEKLGQDQRGARAWLRALA